MNLKTSERPNKLNEMIAEGRYYMLEDIRKRMEGTTPSPWRWGDWSTNFYSKEPFDIEDRMTLEHAPHYKQHEADVRIPNDTGVRVLALDEPMTNIRDAEFISHAKEDIISLLSLIDKYKSESESKFGKSIISPLVISLQKENLKYKEALKNLHDSCMVPELVPWADKEDDKNYRRCYQETEDILEKE